MTLERCLTELADQNKPVLALGLAQLSDSSPEEVRLFQETWRKLEAERRQEVIGELIALARGNAKLNFDSVFLSCLPDADATVRARAIEGLWECDDCTLVSVLMKMLEEDRDDVVRVAAVSKLGRLALFAELRKVHSRHVKTIGDALFRIVNNKEEEVELKCEAMEALASLALPGVKEVIDKAYYSGDPKMRLRALRAMGLNCNRTWLAILLKELDNPELEICLEAVGACGELGEEEVVPHLLRLIRRSNIRVQLAALEALKQLGGSEAKQALYQCLHHPDEQVRQLAGQIWEEVEI